ncbi:WG repeat-containing protein [Dysgonomonas sp. ZJ709]|uniref:WG repeat-containing protein n=1 Tax=Dysgonomonas sp. ZJ709 TaxID=2709797 RepID=UPI0013ED910F|nr:WG repeat-containing protein [Dysgonomonas sp. ZJ709]
MTLIRVSISLILYFIFSLAAKTQDKDIFLIKTDSGYTYIDNNGNLIINKTFDHAGRFFEGKAVATLNGYAGYINRKGEFIIKPQFEYALPFHAGVARVWKNKKPYLIDDRGNIMFSHNYKFIDHACTDKNIPLFKVTTQKDNLTGLVDKYGKSIMSPQKFDRFSLFNDDVSVVQKGYMEYGVVNTKGTIIVPFGEYNHISEFSNGMALVESKNWENKTIGFINTKGELVFKRKKSTLVGKQYSDDRCLVEWESGTDNITMYDILDKKGNIVYSHIGENVSTISPFRLGYSLIEENKAETMYYLWDVDGNIVRLDNTPVYGYDKEKELYLTDNAIVDKKGTVISKIGTEGNPWYPVLKEGDFWLLNNINPAIGGNFATDCWYLANNHINNESNSFYYSVDYESGLIGDLLYVELSEGKHAYINKNLITIWMQDCREQSKYNVDYAIDGGHFYEVKEYSQYEDYGYKSAKKITNDLKHDNSISLVISPIQVEENIFNGKKLHYECYLINPTNDTISIDDSKLEITAQAKDKKGIWQDIQSRSGSLSHTVTDKKTMLKPNEYWAVLTPVYDGGFETEMRLIVNLGVKSGTKGKTSYYKTIISNSIKCHINAAQFLRQEHTKKDKEFYPFEDYTFDRMTIIL